MYYNKLIICGRVSSAPTIRESKSTKNNFVTLRVGVKRASKRKKAEGTYDNFTLYAYGEVGNSLLEKVKEGNYILVTGTVGATAYKRKGSDDLGVNLTLLVQKWEFDPTIQMENEAMKELYSGTENMPEDYEEDVNEETLI